jgi:hypothetical protein
VPPPPADPGAPLDPQEQLAAVVEHVFASLNRTLTDEPTAEAYVTTLRVVTNLFDGALAQGVVDGKAHRTLTGMLEGLQGVPGTLAPGTRG